MKMNYLIPAMAALMFAACNNNETGQPGDATERVPVEFRATVGVTSRAVEQTWSDNDAIGIFMVTAEADLLPAHISEEAENIRYATHTASLGAFDPDGVAPIYYPMDNSGVDFYAYYPQGAVIQGSEPAHYLYAVDVSIQDNQEALNLMYSDNVKTRNKTDKTAALVFNHRLCKLILTVEPGEGVTADDMSALTVQVNNQNTTATFDLSTGALKDDAASPADIPLFKRPGAYVYEAILLPEATTSRTFGFDLNNGHDAPFTWEMEKALVAGSKYTYTVKLNRTGVEVTGTIGSWNQEDGGTVDAN